MKEHKNGRQKIVDMISRNEALAARKFRELNQDLIEGNEDDCIPLGAIIAQYSTTKAITPDLPIEEPDNSLNMGDEHLDTIPATESDEVIKSSVENLKHEYFMQSTCTDSLEEENEEQEEKEFDLEDILQIQNVILREKLLNIHRLISKIESLKDIPTPDRVLKSPSSFPIPVADSDSFLEESDTSLSHLDNS
ncbi:hypothetical protein Tco_1210477 [Tanacetum coccineum]